MDLEQTAIERLRMASEMSLRLYKQPLVITYSGGKDSDVLLHLAGKHRKEQFARYPKYRDAYIRAFGRMLECQKRKGLSGPWQTGEDVHHWWLEDGVLPGQMVLEGMEDVTL